jgi:ABC-type sugar transport system substrate-binding protein
MRKPDSPFISTTVTDPDMIARTCVDKLTEVLKGNTLSEKHIYVPAKLITKDNIPADK